MCRCFGIAHMQPKGTRSHSRDFRCPEGSSAVALFHGSERGQLPMQEEGKEGHAPFNEETSPGPASATGCSVTSTLRGQPEYLVYGQS